MLPRRFREAGIGQRRGYRTALKGCWGASSPLQGVRCRSIFLRKTLFHPPWSHHFRIPIPQNAAIALTEICPALPSNGVSGIHVNLIVRIFLRQPVQPMISSDINPSFPAVLVRPNIHTRNCLSDKNTVKQCVIPCCHDNMVEISVAAFPAVPRLNFSELLLK